MKYQKEKQRAEEKRTGKKCSQKERNFSLKPQLNITGYSDVLQQNMSEGEA